MTSCLSLLHQCNRDEWNEEIIVLFLDCRLWDDAAHIKTLHYLIWASWRTRLTLRNKLLNITHSTESLFWSLPVVKHQPVQTALSFLLLAVYAVLCVLALRSFCSFVIGLVDIYESFAVSWSPPIWTFICGSWNSGKRQIFCNYVWLCQWNLRLHVCLRVSTALSVFSWCCFEGRTVNSKLCFLFPLNHSSPPSFLRHWTVLSSTSCSLFVFVHPVQWQPYG